MLSRIRSERHASEKRPAGGWRETAMEKDGATSLGLFSKAMGKAFFISVAGGRSEPDCASRRYISFHQNPATLRVFC
jgi:hypothetical protein